MPYTVVNERSLMTVNSIKIPDRVVFNGKDAIVIDYKTGEIKKQHEEQLNEYAVELAKFGFENLRKILVYPPYLGIYQ